MQVQDKKRRDDDVIEHKQSCENNFVVPLSGGPENELPHRTNWSSVVIMTVFARGQNQFYHKNTVFSLSIREDMPKRTM